MSTSTSLISSADTTGRGSVHGSGQGTVAAAAPRALHAPGQEEGSTSAKVRLAGSSHVSGRTVRRSILQMFSSTKNGAGGYSTTSGVEGTQELSCAVKESHTSSPPPPSSISPSPNAINVDGALQVPGGAGMTGSGRRAGFRDIVVRVAWRHAYSLFIHPVE